MTDLLYQPSRCQAQSAHIIDMQLPKARRDTIPRDIIPLKEQDLLATEHRRPRVLQRVRLKRPSMLTKDYQMCL